MREGVVNERSRNIWTLAAGAVVLAAGTAAVTAQVTGGQANAARAAAAQAAAAPASPARPAQSSAQAPSATPPAPVSAAGRRDPFRPLIIKGQGGDLPARLPPGKPGLVVGQLTIQGIVRGLSGEWIAVVDNKTNRAYFLYVGDELFNGTVSRITADAVVFDERVLDAQGRMVTREVVKRLNPS
jgi:hypothetical protein